MPVLTIQSGFDTTILSTQTANNFGAQDRFQAGRSAAGGQVRRSMYQPDLTALLAISGATISSAIVELFCLAEVGVNDFNVMAHLALRQWYEGVQNGNPPGAADGSTWAQRNANTGTPLAWGSAGGLAGTDFATVASATTLITGTGVSFQWDVTTDVQNTYAAGGVNFWGWWFKMSTTDEGTASSNKAFTSFQHATSSNWPKLIVTYTAPGLLPKLMQYGQYSGGTL